MTEYKDTPEISFYSKKTSGAGKRLQRIIETFVPESSLSVCRKFDVLLNKLHQPGHNIGILILLTTSKKELLEILTIKDLLSDIRIIAVLPDREKDTISNGHGLHPRYVTYADSDFIEVGAVLAKMMHNSD